MDARSINSFHNWWNPGPSSLFRVPNGIVTFSFEMKNRRGLEASRNSFRSEANCGLPDTSNVQSWLPRF